MLKGGEKRGKELALARRGWCGLLKCEARLVMCALEFFICLHPCLFCPWSRGCSLEDEAEATPQSEIERDANPDRLVIKKPSEKRKSQSRKGERV